MSAGNNPYFGSTDNSGSGGTAGSGGSSHPTGTTRKHGGTVSLQWGNYRTVATGDPLLSGDTSTPELSSADTTPNARYGGTGRGTQQHPSVALQRRVVMPALQPQGTDDNDVMSHSANPLLSNTPSDVSSRGRTPNPNAAAGAQQQYYPPAPPNMIPRSDFPTVDSILETSDSGDDPFAGTENDSEVFTTTETARSVRPPSAAGTEDDWSNWYEAEDGYWYRKDSSYYQRLMKTESTTFSAEPSPSTSSAQVPVVAAPPIPSVPAPSPPQKHAQQQQPSPAGRNGPAPPLLLNPNPLEGRREGSPTELPRGPSPRTTPSSAASPRSFGSPMAPSPSSGEDGSSPQAGGSQRPHSSSNLTNTSLTTTSTNFKFRKIRDLGRGAFGDVFLAMNILTGELMAVKQIRVDDGVSTKVVRDAQREINVMVRLPEHPNCVKYLGSQEKGKDILICMEFVSGGSVESLLKATGRRFHEATIQQYAFMVLLGLQHLHLHNIIHQDIKGANVLIDTNGIAKIADFGCCRDLSAMHMNSSKTTGSPLFMAPEVCRGSPADMRSDVWSFGCLILEMAKDDRSPWSGFDKMSLFAVIYAISGAQKPPEIPNHLSSVCQDFLSKCLKLDPAERATIGELLMHPFFTTSFDDDLEGVDSGEMELDKEVEESINRLSQSVDFQKASVILEPQPKHSLLQYQQQPQQALPAAMVGDNKLQRESSTQSVGDSQALFNFSLRSTRSTYSTYQDLGLPQQRAAEDTDVQKVNPLKQTGGIGSSPRSGGGEADGSPRHRRSLLLDPSSTDSDLTGSPLLMGMGKSAPTEDQQEDDIPTIHPGRPHNPATGGGGGGAPRGEVEPVIYHSSGGGMLNQGGTLGVKSKATPDDGTAGNTADTDADSCRQPITGTANPQQANDELPASEGQIQLTVVEYVANSQTNRKKKGAFAKLADRFRCVTF